MKRYVVTGGAGFIGSSLARSLIKLGNEVHIIDDLSTGQERNIPEGSVFHKADISDMKALLHLPLPDKIDCVYHLAAQSSGEASFDDPAADIEINYRATYNALKAASTRRCRRFIYSSTMSVYGEVPVSHGPISEDYPPSPVSYYGCNKLASEKIIKVFSKTGDMDATIFRIFSAYGPGQNMMNMRQGMISIYISYLLNNVPIEVKGSLERFRDCVYVGDIVDVLINSEEREETYGGIFNLGTSVKTTVREMLAVILEIFGKDDFDKWVVVRGSTAGDTAGCVADIGRLKRALSWKPRYALRDGITGMKTSLEGEAAGK